MQQIILIGSAIATLGGFGLVLFALTHTSPTKNQGRVSRLRSIALLVGFAITLLGAGGTISQLPLYQYMAMLN